MSRIESYLLGLITLCTTSVALGQTQISEPLQCATPPSGHRSGGDFTIAPNVGCIGKANAATGGAPINLTGEITPNGPFSMGSIKLNYNYKDIDGALTFNTTLRTHTYTNPGIYWIALTGTETNASGTTTSWVKCKPIEIIKTAELEVDVNACDPLRVSVTIKDTPSNRLQSRVDIIWGDGNTRTYDIPSYPFDIPYVYNAPPIDKPKIIGHYLRGNNVACKSDPVDLNFTAPSTPKISELEGLNGGAEDKITIKGGTPGTEYNIEMKTGNGVWAATGKKISAPPASAIASESITGLSGANEYCFRLQKPGACATQVTSNEVCTIKPTHTVQSPKVVKVDWTTAQPGTLTYDIIYIESPSGINQNSSTTNGHTYTFDQMSCNTKYEFRIVGSFGPYNDKVHIKSPSFIVDPATGGKLPSSMIGIASVENNAVRLNMHSNTSITKYNIYKAEGNSTDFKFLTSTNTNAYVDQAVEQDKQQYCYKVDYEDDCANKSEMTDAFCTIFLTSAESNTINWTTFSVAFEPTILQNVQPAEYTIQVLDKDGNVIETPGNTVDNMADVKDVLDRLLNDTDLNGRVIFRILARKDGDFVMPDGSSIDFPVYSYSNKYTFITPAQIYVPSAFTPDMSGPIESETFFATGKYIAEFNMIIYNRWGAPIFESADINRGWDGKENGTPVPAGNYGYKIFGIDNAGQKFVKIGSVLLLK